ncbi:Modification methylase HaeIII [Limihaloglobus sulfuriphilus]|uniref:Cytosine-specific methyltransferase n=1 Tax=Limihaloglobus sulfuriphilus TaxID=1851148 RepID=A0A1Q2MHD0_9BACT|nr:DNA cytosine methyltransferase [Limihaloglobus sulfuriphilus]AQQ72101.1 Modification methylase HaeIII [Limihaloglobus sulfuriphilus]
MSGNVANRKRLISITKGNIKNGHIYLSGHHDFFPKECYGKSNQKAGQGKLLNLFLDGIGDTVQTDISIDRNGNPRNFFRKRDWVARFFQKYRIQEGDVVAIEKIGRYSYRLYPFETQNMRTGAEVSLHWPPLDPRKPTAIDLFAGCGGFSYGLKQAGFENLLSVEWDSACCETFKKNISSRILNCAIQEVVNFPECDLLVGGPPCQGFSNLGEKLPNDPRRQLWRHFIRAVKEAYPLIFIMENVPPIIKSQEYQEILKESQKLGYIIEGRVLNTAFYGVPQQRKRAIIIGSRIGPPAFPKPTHIDPNEKNLYNTELPHWRTVQDAIGDMPRKPDGHNWHIGRNPTAKSQKRYRCIPPGGNRWDLPQELMPECWKRKTKGGTDLFGRLFWDKPSVTIRTEFYKPEKGRYLHPVEHRPITHREAARLQGFEDSFEFIGKKIEVGIQIGNAVPPPFACQIGLTVKKQIDNWKRNQNDVRKSQL